MSVHYLRQAPVLLTLALFLTPLGSANCAGWVEGEADICDRNPTTSPGNPCSTVFAGNNVDVRDGVFTSFALCQDNGQITGLPLDCNNGAGAPNNFGGNAFNTGDCGAYIGCIYDVWVTQTSGVELTGWGLGACTNRDDSGNTCTDIGVHHDDFSHEGGVGVVVVGDGKTESPPGYAHIRFCVRPDSFDGGDDYDDFYVFITNWVDENQVLDEGSGNDNLGTGVGFGAFDVWVSLAHYATSHDDCLAHIKTAPT